MAAHPPPERKAGGECKYVVMYRLEDKDRNLLLTEGHDYHTVNIAIRVHCFPPPHRAPPLLVGEGGK